MSKKRRNNRNELNTLNLSKPNGEDQKSAESSLAKKSIWTKLKNPANWWMIAVIAFLALGALGAGLKYLDEDATREIAGRANNKRSSNNQGEQSFLNKVNPFLSPPDPTPTPQLSKEYIYAGSRLLAVEDKNATSAPPADLAIWRPDTANNTGTWWVMGGQNSQQVTVQWGNSTDKTVPGDYDGDGKTDFSVWRPSTGTWYVANSGGGGQFTFGQTGDLPAQADFDGDGRTDAAVYRPTTGTWYILKSSDGQVITQQWGLASDIPAPADYEGDGKADIAVWRGSTTAFYSLNSSNNQLQTPTFGQSGNTVVSADYDGDGRADYAVYNSTTANWYIRQSANGQVVTYQWGAADDKAVQNDYDGDGKVDIATWRNSNGNWYIRKSGSNGALRQEAWGTSGDIPVPAFYRR